MPRNPAVTKSGRRLLVVALCVSGALALAGCQGPEAVIGFVTETAATPTASQTSPATERAEPSTAPPSLPYGSAVPTTDELTGIWAAPYSPDLTGEPTVEFAAGGQWRGTDGCNDFTGTWRLAVDGGWQADWLTMTEVACGATVDLPGWLIAASAVALVDDGQTLVLLHDGLQLARLAWQGPAQWAPPSLAPPGSER